MIRRPKPADQSPLVQSTTHECWSPEKVREAVAQLRVRLEAMGERFAAVVVSDQPGGNGIRDDVVERFRRCRPNLQTGRLSDSSMVILLPRCSHGRAQRVAADTQLLFAALCPQRAISTLAVAPFQNSPSASEEQRRVWLQFEQRFTDSVC